MPQRFFIDGRWITADQFRELRAKKALEAEQANETEIDEVEDKPMTVKEIKAELTKRGIKFKGNDKGENLAKLLEQAMEAEANKETGEETGEQSTEETNA